MFLTRKKGARAAKAARKELEEKLLRPNEVFLSDAGIFSHRTSMDLHNQQAQDWLEQLTMGKYAYDFRTGEVLFELEQDRDVYLAFVSAGRS